MSFKCSVFGHRFGDPEVEREREEQGSEVVITITETETCQRCGENRVVSENKEVTTLETPSDIVGDDIADADEVDTAATAEPADVGEAEADDDPADGEPTPAVETKTAPVGDQVSATDVSESGPDDAVILDEDGESDDEGRDPGEWPDEDDEDGEDDWSPETGQELRPVEEEQPDLEPAEDTVTLPDGQFYCPECEFTTDVEASSLREGDFCPECHRGSLAHQPDEE